VTKQINELRGTSAKPVWQRNYFERVIRDDEELNRIREYILYNPLKWADNSPREIFLLIAATYSKLESYLTG